MYRKLQQYSLKYKAITTILVFVVVFKFVEVVFYGSYYHFFNRLAVKWNKILFTKFDLSLYFLNLQPYLDYSFFLSSFKSPTTYLGIIVFVYLFKHRDKITWQALSANTLIKLFFLVPGILLCWEMLTYDYNYYLNNYFLLEQILLITFLILIWFNPIYSVWFLMLAFLFRGQFDYPIGGFPLFDKKVLFDIYVLLIAFLLINTRKQLQAQMLPLLLLILMAASYFATGIGKIKFTPHGYEWFLQNPLEYVVMNGNDRGWTVSAVTVGLLAKYKELFQFLIMLLELSTLFMLYKRVGAIILIASCMIMHLFIFYFGGIFFWKWLVVDTMLLVYLSSKSGKKIFKPDFFKASLLVIPLGVFWMSAFTIGWLDTKYNQTFEYEVELKNGNIYNASKSLFNPYHQLFYHDKFLYTLNEKRIKITGFGYTFNYPLSKAINESTIDNLYELEQQYGMNLYNKTKDELHTHFIRTFIQNYNQRINETPLWSFLKAPEHIYNFPEKPVYANQGEIKKVNVYVKKTYIFQHQLHTIERKIVKVIEI